MDIDGIVFDVDLPDDTHSSKTLAAFLDDWWDSMYGTWDAWRQQYRSGEDSRGQRQ